MLVSSIHSSNNNHRFSLRVRSKHLPSRKLNFIIKKKQPAFERMEEIEVKISCLRGKYWGETLSEDHRKA